MQLNLGSLSPSGQQDNYFNHDAYYPGVKGALSESNIFKGKSYSNAPSPQKFPVASSKICNFMQEFEHGSLPAKIHVI